MNAIEITQSEVCEALEVLLPSCDGLDVEALRNGEFRVNYQHGEDFRVQVCPIAEFEAQAAVGELVEMGLWRTDCNAPRIEIAGQEFVVLRQW